MEGYSISKIGHALEIPVRLGYAGIQVVKVKEWLADDVITTSRDYAIWK